MVSSLIYPFKMVDLSIVFGKPSPEAHPVGTPKGSLRWLQGLLGLAESDSGSTLLPLLPLLSQGCHQAAACYKKTKLRSVEKIGVNAS